MAVCDGGRLYWFAGRCADFDGDGLCEVGDNDDGDMVEEPGDNCPFKASPEQLNSHAIGVGDACEENQTFCLLIHGRNVKHRLTNNNQCLHSLTNIHTL
jgi:hypothetical protein